MLEFIAGNCYGQSKKFIWMFRVKTIPIRRGKRAPASVAVATLEIRKAPREPADIKLNIEMNFGVRVAPPGPQQRSWKNT